MPPPALRSRRFCTPEEARSHVRPQTHGHDLLSPCKVVAIMTPCSIGLTRTRCPMLFFLPPLFTTSPQARWKTGESAPPPPSGQELYRISLLNMAKLEEPFPSPQTQAQATNPLSRANAVHQPPQEPHDYSYLLGGAGAGLRQHQGFTEPQVPPPMIPVGSIAHGLVGGQQHTQDHSHEEWLLPASTGGDTSSVLRGGNVVAGGRWGESTRGRGTGEFDGPTEVMKETTCVEAVAAAAALKSPQGSVDTAASVAAAAAQASGGSQGQQQHRQQHKQDTAGAGGCFDFIFKEITVEGEEAREQEFERERQRQQERGERCLGEGTADAPLELGDEYVQSPSLAGKGCGGERCSLNHVRKGTAGVTGDQPKRRSPSGVRSPQGAEERAVRGETAAGDGLQRSISPVDKRGGTSVGVDGGETGGEPDKSADVGIEHTLTVAAAGKGADVQGAKEGGTSSPPKGSPKETDTDQTSMPTSKAPTGVRGRGPGEGKGKGKGKGGNAGGTKRSRLRYEISDFNKSGTHLNGSGRHVV